MTKQDRDLTALIGSRICHDLISPLGAIGNGIELLQLSGLGDSPEISLISQSVANANLRIRFFRVAFGAAQPGQSIGENEIRAILAPTGEARKAKIDWQPVGGQPRDAVKLAFLLLQCLESAMPWGGEVTVSNTGGEWHVQAVADKMKLDPDLWALITAPSDAADIPAAQVQFALIAPELARQGREARLHIGENEVAIAF